MKKFALAQGLCLILSLAAFGFSSCGSTVSSLQADKQTAEAVVHASAVGLGAILESYQNEADRINIIREYIDPIRFYPDGSGYFYVYNLDCVNIAHATQKDLQGQNLYDYQDTRGN